MKKGKKWSLKDQIEHGKFLLRNRDALIETLENKVEILTHGGKRNGSGRKKKEPTITVRIPVRLVDKVKALICSYPSTSTPPTTQNNS